MQNSQMKVTRRVARIGMTWRKKLDKVSTLGADMPGLPPDSCTFVHARN